MKPKIKELWVNALRSGKYQQGKGVLLRDDAYCCLGVLCELAAESGAPVRKVLEFNGAWSFDDFETVLPDSVSKWAGLRTPKGEYNRNALTADNDNGKTFPEIADIIEAHADEL